VPDLEVRRDSAIVEAFPNTFLGVLLPEAAYECWDHIENERKSDWMYRKIAERDTFKVLLADLGWTEASTIDQFQDQARSDGDHDIRGSGLSAHGWVRRFGQRRNRR
jgi:hypothetical protein